MIIDSHAHLVMTDELYRYMGELVASRANPAGPYSGIGAESLRAVSERLEMVEDTLDRVTRELAELRQERDSARSGPSSRS